MKLKKDLKLSTDDFWYDLIDGQYFRLEAMLEDKKDIDEIEEAIEVLVKFKNSCEEQIENFIQ